MSFLLGYPKAIPYRAFTKFEHFGIIRFFLSYAPDISVKNALIDPVTVTFDLSTPKPYPRSFPTLYKVWTLWDHSFLSYAADKQTNKQWDPNILRTSTDTVVMGNYALTPCIAVGLAV